MTETVSRLWRIVEIPILLNVIYVLILVLMLFKSGNIEFIYERF